jgi:hypothetical protein
MGVVDDRKGSGSRGGGRHAGRALWKRALLTLAGVLGLALFLGLATGVVRSVAGMVIGPVLAAAGDPSQEVEACSSQDTADAGREETGTRGAGGGPGSCLERAIPGAEGIQGAGDP